MSDESKEAKRFKLQQMYQHKPGTKYVRVRNKRAKGDVDGIPPGGEGVVPEGVAKTYSMHLDTLGAAEAPSDPDAPEDDKNADPRAAYRELMAKIPEMNNEEELLALMEDKRSSVAKAAADRLEALTKA